MAKIVRISSEILDGKMGNEPHFVFVILGKLEKLADSKTNKQAKGSPSYFYLDFSVSTSQIGPKCQFLGGKIFLKLILIGL